MPFSRPSVKPPIARRGTEHGSGLGAQRQVVERAFAHSHGFRRLRIRRKIRDDIDEVSLALALALALRIIRRRRRRALAGDARS